MKSRQNELNAVTLKTMLWNTMHQLRLGKVSAMTANAVATQAREILRAARFQMDVMNKPTKKVSAELQRFANPGKRSNPQGDKSA